MVVSLLAADTALILWQTTVYAADMYLMAFGFGYAKLGIG